MALTFDVSEIITIYNSYPGLLKDKITGVSLMQDTTGKSNSVLLEKSKNGNYWLLEISLQNKQKYFLLPQPNVTFSEFKLKYFTQLFTYEGTYDHAKHPFKLDRLAELKLTSIPDQWALVTKGQITFVEELSQVWLLQSQIEHLQTEIANLSNTLNHTQSECQKFQRMVQEKDQKIKELEKQLTELRKTYENAWQQSLIEQRATRNDRERLQSSVDMLKEENLNLVRQINFWEDQYKLLQKELEVLLPSYQDLKAIGEDLIYIAENQNEQIKLLSSKRPDHPFLFRDTSGYPASTSDYPASTSGYPASDYSTNYTTPVHGSQFNQMDVTPQNSISSIQQFIEVYNNSPGSLQGIGVLETEESFNQRRSGLNIAAVLHNASNPSFYIVQDMYLVPRPGSKVTTHKLNTIDALFDCENFSSGAPFQLIAPAIVSPLANNQWQLNQKGKLKFL